jgi:hypothetical protein
MRDQTFTGVGCFAKPDRLGRIFRKLVQSYTLGPFNENQLFDGSLSKKSEGAVLLQALMAGLTIGSGSADRATLSLGRPKKITGFYLSLNDQKLNLRIFARGNSTRPEIFTTSLDELTKLRRKRLN